MIFADHYHSISIMQLLKVILTHGRQDRIQQTGLVSHANVLPEACFLCMHFLAMRYETDMMLYCAWSSFFFYTFLITGTGALQIRFIISPTVTAEVRYINVASPWGVPAISTALLEWRNQTD